MPNRHGVSVVFIWGTLWK